MNSIKYFIPVDFSEASFKAIQYASMLADKTGGIIHLGHVIDADEIVESDNPVIVQWNLDRLEKMASDKMQSLKELISSNGIAVTSEITFGRLQSVVLKMISRLTPDVIVLPRRVSNGSKPELLTHLSKHCKQPLLVVPEAFVPQVPERAVVATDLRPANGELDTLFQLIGKSANEISLLNIRSSVAPKEVVKAQWISTLEEKYRLDTKLLQQENDNVVLGVINFVNSNPVDLVCTIRRNKNFLARALGESVSDEIARQAEVPVLVISE
ncbi:universal stress protein [Oscillatoria amoena NRMC-F 0135]|nr:universal stress protein [Oscillatoria amoena NRMC-F 0135]